jgi:hypothetical protein
MCPLKEQPIGGKRSRRLQIVSLFRGVGDRADTYELCRVKWRGAGSETYRGAPNRVGLIAAQALVSKPYGLSYRPWASAAALF